MTRSDMLAGGNSNNRKIYEAEGINEDGDVFSSQRSFAVPYLWSDGMNRA